jgi:hypothetical protein
VRHAKLHEAVQVVRSGRGMLYACGMQCFDAEAPAPSLVKLLHDSPAMAEGQVIVPGCGCARPDVKESVLRISELTLSADPNCTACSRGSGVTTCPQGYGMIHNNIIIITCMVHCVIQTHKIRAREAGVGNEGKG